MSSAVTVAFVDDEESFHHIVKVVFRNEVQEGKLILNHFLNGREFLDFLEAGNSVSILFSDITMPIMDGFTLAKHVVEDYKDIDIHMISALDFEEYQKKTSEFGGLSFFQKPVNFNEIKKLLFES